MLWCPNGSPGPVVCCVDVQYEQAVLILTTGWPMGGGRQALDAAFSAPDWSSRTVVWRGTHQYRLPPPRPGSTCSKVKPCSPATPLMDVKNRQLPSGYGTKSTDLSPCLAFTDTLLSLERTPEVHRLVQMFMPGGGWEEVRGSIPYVGQVPTLDRASDVAALRTKFSTKCEIDDISVQYQPRPRAAAEDEGRGRKGDLTGNRGEMRKCWAGAAISNVSRGPLQDREIRLNGRLDRPPLVPERGAAKTKQAATTVPAKHVNNASSSQVGRGRRS
ncbi:hypothetical protein F5144DRAFT_383321 [Chaetomium tenue]|uniref:Uncharacterized protein n=1 Tax=Chaetomium tenue TaxID=1854479 RepID=A0ACB7NWG2_9PEZI|nr:hypothetical protein F5144DRAFT_383321 [Chaetomium globosum]